MTAKTQVIHVNTHTIRKNNERVRKGQADKLEPPLTTKPKAGGKARAGNTLSIRVRGKEVARVVYRPLAPLKSGATAWVETDHDVVVVPDEPTVGAQPQSQTLEALLRTLVLQNRDLVKKMLEEAA